MQSRAPRRTPTLGPGGSSKASLSKLPKILRGLTQFGRRKLGEDPNGCSVRQSIVLMGQKLLIFKVIWLESLIIVGYATIKPGSSESRPNQEETGTRQFLRDMRVGYGVSVQAEVYHD